MATIWCVTEHRYLDQRMPRAVIEWLEQQGLPVRAVVADRETVRIDGHCVSSPWQALRAGDVVVSRARHPLALALLDAAGRLGADVVTPWAGVEAVRNKARCADLLAAHNLPTPATYLVAAPTALTGLDPSCFPLVLKPHLGDNATGVTVVHDAADLDAVANTDGLLLAQQWVDTGGWDVKLSVCGERVWAVRRRSPLSAGQASTDAADAMDVTPEHLWIARACRDTFGLPLCGVDLVMSERGPLIVDVNDFPNYTGVAEAPSAVGTLLAERLARVAGPLLPGAASCAS